MSAPSELGCDHCGDVAIESASGMFAEDDGGACMSCGFPGSVSVGESFDDAEEWAIGTASWLCSDAGDAVCSDETCEDCAPHREAP